MEQGLIHIYCGDGKGKTSAAIGLAVRAAGSGLKVLFTRFLKNESSGELAILDDISQIKVLHLEKSFRREKAGSKGNLLAALESD